MLKKWWLDILLLIITVAVSVFAMISLAFPGLPTFHDANPHISRMVAFHTALEDGQMPPLWAKEMLGGIGSPVMMLNYQLPYFISEVWVGLGLNYFDSYKLTLGLSFIVSGIFMYIALRSRYPSPPSFLGASLYLFAPYRMVDIFVRGAYGESLSFLFPPLILLGYFRGSVPWLIIGWCGLFLTHPLASAAFTVFFLIYSLITTTKDRVLTWTKQVVAYGTALLIASFNLLPTLSLTKLTYYTPQDSSPLTQFPTLRQLLYSPWGYGVSLPGSDDGMSFMIGYGHLIVIALSLIVIIHDRVKLRSTNVTTTYLVTMVFLSLYFMLEVSAPLYRLLDLSRLIDLPWRLLLCVVFAVAWLGPILLSRLLRIHQLPVALVAAFLLVVLSYPMMQPPTTRWHKSPTFFARETGDSYGEYAPRSRSTRDSAPFGLRAEVISGEATVTPQVIRSNEQSFLVESQESNVIRINTAYFPGWQIRINDTIVAPDTKQVETSVHSTCYVTMRTLSHIDDSGLVACHLEPGRHTLSITYHPLPVQKLGNLLSLAGIGVLIWHMFQSFFRPTTNAKL